MKAAFNVTAGGIFVAVGYKSAVGFQLVRSERALYTMKSDADIKVIRNQLRNMVEKLVEEDRCNHFIYLGSTVGPKGSSLETIRVETLLIAEVLETEVAIDKLSPQRLPTALGAAKGMPWRKAAKALLNPKGEVQYWSSGADGAVTACYVSNA